MSESNDNKIISIKMSDKSGAILRQNGTVTLWGNELSGGVATSKGENVDLTNVKKIFMGPNAGAAIKNDGSAVVWGDQKKGGYLGNTNLDGSSEVIDIFISNTLSFAIKQDGTVASWGRFESDNILEEHPEFNNVKKIIFGNILENFQAAGIDIPIYLLYNDGTASYVEGTGNEYMNPNVSIPDNYKDAFGFNQETNKLENIKKLTMGSGLTAIIDNNNIAYFWGNFQFSFINISFEPRALRNIKDVIASKFFFFILDTTGHVRIIIAESSVRSAIPSQSFAENIQNFIDTVNSTGGINKIYVNNEILGVLDNNGKAHLFFGNPVNIHDDNAPGWLEKDIHIIRENVEEISLSSKSGAILYKDNTIELFGNPVNGGKPNVYHNNSSYFYQESSGLNIEPENKISSTDILIKVGRYDEIRDVGIKKKNISRNIHNFYCKYISHLTFNDDIAIISAEVFEENKDLVSVIMPNGIEKINQRAFKNCRNLTSIVIPDVFSFSFGDYVFSGCSNLTSVILPNNLLELSEGLFMACSNLESIILPRFLEIIKRRSFQNCRKLKSITIPSSVKKIETSAFQNCASLRNIRFLKNTRNRDRVSLEKDSFLNIGCPGVNYFMKLIRMIRSGNIVNIVNCENEQFIEETTAAQETTSQGTPSQETTSQGTPSQETTSQETTTAQGTTSSNIGIIVGATMGSLIVIVIYIYRNKIKDIWNRYYK